MLEYRDDEILFSEVKDVIDLIYDPDRPTIDWHTVCGEVSQLDSRFDVFFYQRNRILRPVDSIISNIDPEYLRMYKEKYVDANPFLKKLEKSGGVYQATRLLSPAELGRSDFVTRWFLPQGYREAVVSYVGDDAVMQQLFALKLKTDEESAVRRAQTLLGVLYPHFRRATTLKARLRMLDSSQRNFFSETFEFSRLEATTQECTGSGFLVRHVKFDGSTLRFYDDCGAVLAEMDNKALDAGLKSSAAKPIFAEHGRIVACFVMPASSEDGFVVNVVDTDSKPDWFSDYFWQCDISKAEYGVLAAYCLGISIKNIASIRQRSAETIKRQLKNAMAKIGVTKQEDAVRTFFRLMLRDDRALQPRSEA